MSAVTLPCLTPEEYLDQERRSPHKHEYFRGQAFLMTGASENHNLIVANLIHLLVAALRGKPCRVYPSDMRVRCPGGLMTYPDAIVCCGERQFFDERRDTLLNPNVLFEVLSPSTERYDRDTKFDHYSAIPSLREYVLIAQDRVRVNVFTRSEGEGWEFRNYHQREDQLLLRTGDVLLPLRDLYANVDLLEETGDGDPSVNGTNATPGTGGVSE